MARTRSWPWLLLLLATVPGVALAVQYWSRDALLRDMFPKAAVEAHTLVLDAAEKAEFKADLGYRPPHEKWTIWVARAGGRVVGYALFDAQQGQHEPITFAVQVGPDGAVRRQEVVAYREAYGDGIRDPRFRAQFVGKTADDPLKPGVDIDAVSGATCSSRAMAVGVKRALVVLRLYTEHVAHGGTD